MARPKKDYKAVSFKLAASIYDRLDSFCERTGQSKTYAMERALSEYMDDYDEKMKIIKEIQDKRN